MLSKVHCIGRKKSPPEGGRVTEKGDLETMYPFLIFIRKQFEEDKKKIIYRINMLYYKD